MKKTIATAVITAIVTAAIAIACFAGCSKKSVKQTATVYLDQEENSVEATIDLSDGYSCEFARGAVYLYDQEIKDDVSPVVIGITLDQEVYNDYLESSKSDANRKDLGGGVLFQADGQFIHISRIDDSRYFGIFGENTTPSQMEKYVARFNVVPEI